MHYLTDVDRLLFAYGTSSRASDSTGAASGRGGSRRSARCTCATASTTSGSTTRSTSRWPGAWRSTDSRWSTTQPPAASCRGRSTSRSSAAAARPRAGRRRRSRDCTTHPELRAVPAGRGRRRALAARREPELDALCARIRELEAALANDVPADERQGADELHRAYRAVVPGRHREGASPTAWRAHRSRAAPEHARRERPDPRCRPSREPCERRQTARRPRITVTMPVWSRDARSWRRWRCGRSSASGRSRGCRPRSSSSTTARPSRIPSCARGCTASRRTAGSRPAGTRASSSRARR